ncbi:MAG TPA: 23S rRNA (guanosine(2251)-2'-O)-methyltransferase RlmB [Chakrabartia sp.]|jgi:23S rRNA (guanosine2251-2'-O)-methyltransferase|nr:23S rRNA (guanosine(2251)-2'-O)-methyltransferase RlmB [Chakrabartia sp.]
MKPGRGRREQGSKGPGRTHFWGRHAVEAALANPDRVIRKMWGTRETLDTLDIPKGMPVTFAEGADLGRLVARDAPHQGVVIEVDPLPDIWLDDVLGPDEKSRPLLVLDQVTDPHNVGAILRSAAAFDARAIVTQDRHSPPESGSLAKAASGALERVPWVRVVNLARALDDMAAAGFWRIGLSGHAKQTLDQALGTNRLALVLGAEGEGLRQNTEAHCDELARLPISNAIESLNVSNAAAIALYAAATRKG